MLTLALYIDWRILLPRSLLEGAHRAIRQGEVHDRLVVEEVVSLQPSALLPSLSLVHQVALHRIVHVAPSAQAPEGLHSLHRITRLTQLGRLKFLRSILLDLTRKITHY